MIVNFTNSSGLNDVDLNVEQIKSIIKLVRGQLPLRKAKNAEAWEQIMGWPVPRELDCWLGVPHWPTEEFELRLKKKRVIIDIPYYLSNSFVFSILKGRDDNDRLAVRYNNPETAQLIFTGLVYAGNDPTGDSYFLDAGPDTDITYTAVYRYDNNLARVRELKESSFCAFVLNAGCQYLETHEDSTPNEQIALRTLRQLYGEISSKNEVSSKRENTVVRRARRSRWLIALLTQKGQVLGEEIVSSPKYATWKREEESLQDEPLNLHYWMLAHYFLDNIEECEPCVELAMESESLLTREIAKSVRRLLKDPDHASLGEIDAHHLQQIKEEVRKYLVPGHHAPDKREEVLEEKGGVPDLSPLALIKAVRQNNREKITELINAGQDINEPYDFETAMSVAAESGNIDLVRFLLDQDGEVTVAALHWAVIKGNLELLKTLLKSTRNLKKAFNERYYFGQTLLHCSIKTDNKDVFAYLLKHGADPNIKTDFKETPLMEAAAKGRFEYIDTLIKSGAKVNYKDEQKRTALHYAAENSVKALQKLIKNDANLNPRDSHNRTPLMVAASEGNYKGAKELLKHGAKKNLKDEEGRTAAEIAAERGFDQLAAYIEEFVYHPVNEF